MSKIAAQQLRAAQERWERMGRAKQDEASRLRQMADELQVEGAALLSDAEELGFAAQRMEQEIANG